MRDVPGRRNRRIAWGLLPILMVALTSTDASAQWRDTKTNAPLKETAWRKTSGALGGMLALTDRAQTFLEEWSHTSESHIPKVSSVDRVKRGTTVTALVFLAGCGTEGGSCDASVDFRVLRPDGSVYGEMPNNVAYAGRALKRELVLLSQAHLAIRIEPVDPFGTYAVIAILRERGTKSVVRLKQMFSVIP